MAHRYQQRGHLRTGLRHPCDGNSGDSGLDVVTAGLALTVNAVALADGLLNLKDDYDNGASAGKWTIDIIGTAGAASGAVGVGRLRFAAKAVDNISSAVAKTGKRLRNAANQAKAFTRQANFAKETARLNAALAIKDSGLSQLD